MSVSNSPAGISAHQSRNDPFLGFHSAVVFSAPPLTTELNLACFSTRFCLRWDWVDLELISISTKFDSFHRCWLHLHKRRSQLALFSNGCAMIAMHFVPNNTTRFYLYILAAFRKQKTDWIPTTMLQLPYASTFCFCCQQSRNRTINLTLNNGLAAKRRKSAKFCFFHVSGFTEIRNDTSDYLKLFMPLKSIFFSANF